MVLLCSHLLVGLVDARLERSADETTARDSD
jgi:hypothetical protein